MQNPPIYATIQTTSHNRASRTIPREVFLTTELTIDGFGADGDSAHESVKEHKKRLFSGLKTAEKLLEINKNQSPESVWEQDVAGSNPVIPTNVSVRKRTHIFLCNFRYAHTYKKAADTDHGIRCFFFEKVPLFHHKNNTFSFRVPQTAASRSRSAA